VEYIYRLYAFIFSLVVLLLFYSLVATPEASYKWSLKLVEDVDFPKWAQISTIQLAKEEDGWSLTIHLGEHIPKSNETIFLVLFDISLDSDGNPNTGREYSFGIGGIECILTVLVNPHINLSKLRIPAPTSLYCDKEGSSRPAYEFKNSKVLVVYLPEYVVKTENLSLILKTPITAALIVMQEKGE